MARVKIVNEEDLIQDALTRVLQPHRFIDCNSRGTSSSFLVQEILREVSTTIAFFFFSHF